MASTINTKIQLRTDLRANWESVNPVLKLGEIAIVCFDNDYKDIKIGNGISSFNQLSYLYQNAISAESITGKDLHVKSIAQGYNVKATPTSLATGVYTRAEGNFNVVHGIEAQAKAGDDYAFVFNGKNLPLDGENFYVSHGEGTFNINPKDGLSGFYIGEDSAAAILSNYFLSSEISNYYDKTQVNGLWLDLDNKIIVVDNKVENIVSNYVKLSSETTQNLSTNIEMQGFLKVGGITVQGRKFVEIASSLKPLAQQSRTMIGQTYQMISTDFINHYIQGHIYLLTVDVNDQLEYKDITNLNEMSVTYNEGSEDLQFDSHVGSAQYDEATQDLDLQILRM